MKIRIKGNSIRLRLTKRDVQALRETGKVTESTVVSQGNVFTYILQKNTEAPKMHCTFADGNMTVHLPHDKLCILIYTDEIGVQEYADNGEEGGLFLLVEKDLKCLDTTSEDQSDMYDNPKTSC